MPPATRSAAEPGEEAKARWTSRLGSEVDFWEEWLASKGGRWAADYLRLFDRTRLLEPQFRDIIPASPRAIVKLLDVGAGPITPFAVKWPGRHLVTFAVDPLAKEYEAALVRNGVVPPVWTQPGEAERLTELFPPDEFDLVHASNCIDHSWDPVAAVRQMLVVAKPGCCVALEHAQNEGVFQNYDGLHQWNFDCQDGELVIWRPGQRTVVGREFARVCSVDVKVTDLADGRKWISARLRKQAAASARPLRYHLADRLNLAAKTLPRVHGLLRRAARLVR